MVQDLSEESIKDQYELYNRLKNKSRKKLLRFLYEQPRNYKELAEFSELKPGSLYHHLGVLEPLIEKFDHGQYKITEVGTEVIESLDMVTSERQKPKISSVKEKNDLMDIEEESGERPKITAINDKTFITPKSENKEEIVIHENITESTDDVDEHKLLYYIWLSPTSYILLVVSFLVMLLLGLQGVAFAGSAIYAVGDSNAFLVDLLAILLGIGSLLIVEDIIQKYPVYARLKFIAIIRIISMIPSLIIGITLLLLFMTGIIPPAEIYPIIFAIGLVLGTIAMSVGIHFLRGQPVSDAILYAIIPSSIDLLIGVVILLSI